MGSTRRDLVVVRRTFNITTKNGYEKISGYAKENGYVILNEPEGLTDDKYKNFKLRIEAAREPAENNSRCMQLVNCINRRLREESAIKRYYNPSLYDIRFDGVGWQLDIAHAFLLLKVLKCGRYHVRVNGFAKPVESAQTLVGLTTELICSLVAGRWHNSAFNFDTQAMFNTNDVLSWIAERKDVRSVTASIEKTIESNHQPSIKKVCRNIEILDKSIFEVLSAIETLAGFIQHEFEYESIAKIDNGIYTDLVDAVVKKHWIRGAIFNMCVHSGRNQLPPVWTNIADEFNWYHKSALHLIELCSKVERVVD